MVILNKGSILQQQFAVMISNHPACHPLGGKTPPGEVSSRSCVMSQLLSEQPLGLNCWCGWVWSRIPVLKEENSSSASPAMAWRPLRAEQSRLLGPGDTTSSEQEELELVCQSKLYYSFFEKLFPNIQPVIPLARLEGNTGIPWIRWEMSRWAAGGAQDVQVRPEPLQQHRGAPKIRRSLQCPELPPRATNPEKMGLGTGNRE